MQIHMQSSLQGLQSKASPALAGAQPLCTCRVRRAQRIRVAPRNAVKEIFMPALSSTMTEGKIVSWLKTEGDKIAKGESVVVVESDKADMDVESFQDGILGAIVIQEGGTANVGEPIAFVAETEADLDEAKSKAGGSATNGAAAPPPKQEAKEEVKEKQPAMAVASNTTSEPPSSQAAPSPHAPPPPPPPAAAPQKRADGRVVATPYAKKLAKDLGVDLNNVAGSGPAGRITASDIEAFKKGPAAPPSTNGAAAAPTKPAPPPPGPSAVPASAAAPAPAAGTAGTTVAELRGTTQPFTSLQSAVSKNMVESLKVPEFRAAYTVTTDQLETLAGKLKPQGVTMTALLAKAAAVALEKHPLLYAACTPDAKGITYNEHVNIALAVTMPDGGLITPVLKDADKTDIYQLSRNWADLVKRARGKQLAPDEFNSGTFTISNMGMYGPDAFDAILPPGTAAILAVAGSKPTVTADNQGRIGVERQMRINLTCDHRIVYGSQAAEFMQTLKAVLESPDQLVY